MPNNNSTIFIQKTREVTNGDKQLPMLVWSDLNAQSEIYLIADNSIVKPINLSKTGNFTTLITTIAKILGEKDLVAAAKTGDDTTYPIDLIEFANDELNWKPLLEAITDALDLKPTFSIGHNKELAAELSRNFRADLAASSLNAAYDSIINYLAHLGHDLSVNSLGIDGMLSLDEQFRHRMIKHLNDTYAIHFV